MNLILNLDFRRKIAVKIQIIRQACGIRMVPESESEDDSDADIVTQRTNITITSSSQF